MKAFWVPAVVSVLSAVVLLARPPAVGAESVPGEWLVRLSDDSPSAVLAFHDRHPDYEIERLDQFRGLIIVRTPVVTNADPFMNDPAVLSTQPNFRYRAFFTPNDPLFVYQWNFQSVELPAAWDFDSTPPVNGGDPSVVVAVLDTGTAFEQHQSYLAAPDLIGTTFVSGHDFVNDDDHPNDDHGHGTHVTGTIAQATNNGTGTAGIAFSVSVMPIKVLDQNGLGSTATIASGIDYARERGAKVINLSLGGVNDDPVLHAAIATAVSAGIIVIGATGNDGKDTVYFPAAYEEVISVGATRYDGKLAGYSNYGPGLDMVAPGGDLDQDQNGDGQPDGILQQTCSTAACTAFADIFFEGTSQAAPHVAGAAALLLSAGVPSSSIRPVLEGTATDLGSTGYDQTYGWGLLNIRQALTVGLNDATGPTGTVVINGGNQFTKSQTVTLTLTAHDNESTVVSMSFSNDGQSFSAWESFTAEKKAWNLQQFGGSSTEGEKSVRARFRDAAGNVSNLAVAAIIFDVTPPSDPVISVQGPVSTPRVMLHSGIPTPIPSFEAAWEPSTDRGSGVQGYRVLFSPERKPDLSQLPVLSEQKFISPVHDSGRTLFLHVAAVDRAGNEAFASFAYVFQPTRIVVSTFDTVGTISIFDGRRKLAKRFRPDGQQKASDVQAAAVTFQTERANDVLIVSGVGRTVSVVSVDGRTRFSFQPYGRNGPRGIQTHAVDLDRDGISEIVVGPLRGKFPLKIFGIHGREIRSFWPFGDQYDGGMSITSIARNTNDVSLAISRLSGSSTVRVFSPTGRRRGQFQAFPRRSNVGVYIVAGDMNADGQEDIVASTATGSSQIRMLSVRGQLRRQFFAFGKSYRGGIRLALGDAQGDGLLELYTVQSQGSAQIRAFDYRGKRLHVWRGMSAGFSGGVAIGVLP